MYSVSVAAIPGRNVGKVVSGDLPVGSRGVHLRALTNRPWHVPRVKSGLANGWGPVNGTETSDGHASRPNFRPNGDSHHVRVNWFNSQTKARTP